MQLRDNYISRKSDREQILYVRNAVDYVSSYAIGYNNFKKELQRVFGIGVYPTKYGLSYYLPKCRDAIYAKNLGYNYNLENIYNRYGVVYNKTMSHGRSYYETVEIPQYAPMLIPAVSHF